MHSDWSDTPQSPLVLVQLAFLLLDLGHRSLLVFNLVHVSSLVLVHHLGHDSLPPTLARDPGAVLIHLAGDGTPIDFEVRLGEDDAQELVVLLGVPGALFWGGADGHADRLQGWFGSV